MIKKLFHFGRELALSQTARHSYITTFGAGTNAFLGFVFTILVARNLSPADFGVFSALSSLILIILGFSDLGTVSGANRFLPILPQAERKNIIKIVYLFTFLASGVLTLLLFLFSKQVSLFIFKTTNHTDLVSLSSLAVLGLSLWTVSAGLLYAGKNFLKGTLVDISAVIFKLAAVFFFLTYYKLTLHTTVLAFALTPFFALILIIAFIPPDFLLAKLNEKLVRQMFSFSAWIFIAKIAVTILGQVDNLMLIKLDGSTATGLYAAANRITFVFPVLTNGLSFVLMPKFAGFNKTEEAKKFLKKVMIVLGLFTIPVIILYIIADPLVYWIYGSSYVASSEIFRFLLLRTIFYLAATGPLTMLIYFFGQSKNFALLSILQLTILVLGNLIFIPLFGVIGPAISGALAYGVIMIASFFLIFKKLKTQEV